MWLECIRCRKKFPWNIVIYTCDHCGALLDVKYHFEEPKPERWREKPLSVWRYEDFLPRVREKVSLNEGGTSLHRCKRLAEKLGVENIWVKNEGENPTGSFKDRGMTVGVSLAKELGSRTVACASTGNTSASLAAYAAKAGLKCVVMIPSGKIALGKLAQAIMYGALVLAVEGNFDQALSLVEQSSKRLGLYILNSLNPYRLEGQKTIAFEVIEQLGQPPDAIILPVGNAGNISAIHKGIVEWKQLGLIEQVPRLIGIQAEGAAPIAHAYKKKEKEVVFVENPETVATAIRIGKPVNWEKALRAVYDTNGAAETVTDEQILQAQKLLARTEGIFVEPASAASIAGLVKLLDAGLVDKNERIVCVTTGHGLKDPDTPIRTCEKPIQIKPDLEAIEKIVAQ
ncbi:MAG: threonine synthase [Candidatus Freyarchaeota archaeon]|nr:threonine synthase [Candidatus Jordarchaeia archaeon]